VIVCEAMKNAGFNALIVPLGQPFTNQTWIHTLLIKMVRNQEAERQLFLGCIAGPGVFGVKLQQENCSTPLSGVRGGFVYCYNQASPHSSERQ